MDYSIFFQQKGIVKYTHKEKEEIMKRGIGFKRAGNYEAALKCYFTLRNIEGINYEMDYTIAKTFYLKGDYEKALKYYKYSMAYFLMRYGYIDIEDNFKDILELCQGHYKNSTLSERIESLYPEKIVLSLINVNANFHIGHALSVLKKDKYWDEFAAEGYRQLLNGDTGFIKNESHYRNIGINYILDNKNEMYDLPNKMSRGEKLY